MKEKLSGIFERKKFFLTAAGVIFFLVAAFAIARFATKEKPYEKKVYELETENQLAEAVRNYCGIHGAEGEEEKDAIAGEAVSCYRKIIESGVTSVTEEHTLAVCSSIRSVILSLEGVPEENTELLANGAGQIVLEFVLKAVEESGIKEKSAYVEQYMALSESLQKEIDTLKKRNMELSITASISSVGVNEEELDAELEAAKSELYDSYGSDLDSALLNVYRDMDEGMDSLKKEMEKQMEKEISSVKSTQTNQNSSSGINGTNGRDGVNGRDGTNGKDGKNGADGKDGENGEDGATTYVAYAEDAKGTNARETPTEQTKYIGTATSNTGRPDYSSSAWTWTKYKDAIISYDAESNTLKIIQAE